MLSVYRYCIALWTGTVLFCVQVLHCSVYMYCKVVQTLYCSLCTDAVLSCVRSDHRRLRRSTSHHLQHGESVRRSPAVASGLTCAPRAPSSLALPITPSLSPPLTQSPTPLTLSSEQAALGMRRSTNFVIDRLNKKLVLCETSRAWEPNDRPFCFLNTKHSSVELVKLLS